MQRRNFITGLLLAPLGLLGLKVAEPCCSTIQGNRTTTEITFYGLFTEEVDKSKVRLGDRVFVDEKGCCTFNDKNRFIGLVQQIDDNGILVYLTVHHTRGIPVVPIDWIPENGAKGFDPQGYVPSFEPNPIPARGVWWENENYA